MKTKFRKFIAVILMLCIITTLTACNDVRNSQKWVLTHEKWTSYDGTIQQERFYEYDTNGKLIGETLDYGVDGVYTCSEFKYDNSGNVIEKTELYNNPLTNDETIYYYTYTYNDNGTLSKEISKSSTEEFITEYTYDNKGNVIKEIFKDSSGEESIYTYILEYEKDLCIQCEGTIKSTGYNDEYILKQYKYDKNGNKEYELYYNAFDESDDENNTTEVNGKRYKLFITKTYTYEKLSDVAIELETNNNESTLTETQNSEASSNTEDSKEIEEVKLSDSCDMILCTGYDGDDYYELVANQIDGYPDSTFEFGVLKNNEWLVEMSSDCPFIDEDGWWKGTKNSNIPGEFKYMSVGCFYYRRDDESSKGGIIYKPETGINFEVVWFGKFSPYSGSYEEDYSKLINENSEYLGLLNDFTFSYMNLNTGEIRAISLELKGMGNNQNIGLLSDGVFYADASSNFTGTYYSGFFDLNGNQIIDLTKYHCTDLGDYMFHNGQYTLTCKNNSDVEFDITFDTSGKIVSQEKSSVQ